jgi:hypothetical protein
LVALLVAQTALVAARRTPLRRSVGWAGAGLAALVVAVGGTAAILSGRQNIAAGFDDSAREFLTVPLFSMTVFLPLVAAAVALRARPQTHKRLMLLANQ